MIGNPLYLKSLNIHNYRHGEEVPMIVDVVRFKPENLNERPCFMVLYESDNKVDYVPCSEIMEHNWEIV